ncbi:MAG: hypothetical protein EZS28_017547 [Streblomastix strix]|uniref:Uncharacterized protein n=1 Tax=Streblomastix strix TaxID=222440 RepID=A0A5J4VXL8_9EUKA|nr:MAG: hypothetical protein EZS28_017547 [Streblomastix strix]
MGFFSKIANFGSKILGGVKHAAQWVAPALHSVLSKVAGPAGMIHPGIGAALGAGANLAGAVDRLYSKRGGNSGGVYAANNQIVDGQASDFALKIAPDVNQLQSTVGSIDADIVGVKNDIITIQQELARQQHFRGYYLLNSDITSLPDSADGDFAFSAESGTVWMYSDNWYNSGDIVPDQVTPASDAVPLVDNATGAAGISTEYSRGDHQHPLQISSVLPSADTATGEAGTAATYARSDHTHHVNLSNDVPLKDSGTGTAGASNVYASSTHQHPLNVDPTVANVPLVNATAAANGTSDFYCRNDHVHPQQLTYDGNITATKFIKTGGLATEILCANGDTINGVVDLATDQTITGIKTFGEIKAQSFKKINGTNQQILLADGDTKPIIYATRTDYITTSQKYVKLQAYALYYGSETTRTCQLWISLQLWSNYVVIDYTNSGTVIDPITNILTSSPVNELPTDYTQMITLTPNLQFDHKTINNAPFTQNDSMQINPSATSYDDGLRIARSGENSGNSSIQLGCSRTYNTGAIVGQWSIFTPPNTTISSPQSFVIAPASQAGDNNRGLQISADGNTLTFNGRVL